MIEIINEKFLKYKSLKQNFIFKKRVVFNPDKPQKKQFDPKKERIARRAALEFKTGMYANLGIGIPGLVPNFLPKDIQITFHSENGIIGLVIIF